LQSARTAIDLVLRGHEPFPALAVDRHWTLVAANRAVAPLLTAADPALLQPPVNVLRLSLHPAGLAPRIVNLAEWRAHVLARLRRQVDASADRVLAVLLSELRGYPSRQGEHQREHQADARKASDGAAGCAGVVVPLRFASESGVMSFVSTTTVFGTPVEITLSELAIESFFPADAATADALRKIAENCD
jgi:hypothetical protein